MDPYTVLQEQLSNINSNINQGLNKLQDELRLLSRRIDQLESNDHSLGDQIDSIRHSAELLPKIYNNQVGFLETILVGHQYQFRRLSGIVTRDSENAHFPDSTFHNNTNGLNLGASLTQNDNVVQDGSNDPVSVGVGNQNSNQNRLNGVTNNSNDGSNGSLGINPSNSVNNPNNLHQDNSHQVLTTSNRLNSSVNLGLIAPTQNQLSSRRSNNSISSLRNFTAILPIDNEQSVMPITPQPHSSAGQDDASNILNDVQAAEEDSSRRMWENVTFNRLNPNPKTVQEVIDEYYYGHQGQPPLKYLEEHRKEWRKGNKNLSKTFCRRYRIITAVEVGTRLYAREYGTSENIARERTVSELENLRIKENGRKETMYWLFHHIPNHLKRR